MDWVHILNLQGFAQDFLIRVVGFQRHFLCGCLQRVVGTHLVMSDMVRQPQGWNIHIPLSMNLHVYFRSHVSVDKHLQKTTCILNFFLSLKQ